MRGSAIDSSRISRIIRKRQTQLPPFVEYAFYGLILYAIIAEAWGISVPLVGAGGRAVLAIYSLWRLRKSIRSVYNPIGLALCCAVTFLLVQGFFYGESLMSSANREIVNWIFTLIIVQSLLIREHFLHRFGIAAVAIGGLLMPYLVINYSNVSAASVERAGLENSVGLANPDDLAAWFGFCCVFAVVVSIETQRYMVRFASFCVAIVCLGIVGMTVTRAALIGIILAVIIALRRVLKRGFLPVLLLAALVSVVLVSGIFDQAITSYSARGTEDTGRFAVWPIAVERLLASPLFGVGPEKIATYVPETNQELTPHNAFLYVGLMSGIIPLSFFILYLLKGIRGGCELTRKGLQDASFQLPLIIYVLIQALFLAGVFMSPWAIVVLCNAIPRQTGKFALLRSVRRGAVESLKPGEMAHRVARRIDVGTAKS